MSDGPVIRCGGPLMGSETVMGCDCSPASGVLSQTGNGGITMRFLGIVQAEDLRPGQRILVGPGDVQTVAVPSQRDDCGGVSIHTTGGEILANLPCPVKIVE